MADKATIYDVAARAGVSTSTVSRVLNDPGRVKDSTRGRVEAAIEALGYRPSWEARRLSLRRQAPARRPAPADERQRSGLREVLEAEPGEGRVQFVGAWPAAARERVRGAIARARQAAAVAADFWICASFPLAGRRVYAVLPLAESARFVQALSVDGLIRQLSELHV